MSDTFRQLAEREAAASRVMARATSWPPSAKPPTP